MAANLWRVAAESARSDSRTDAELLRQFTQSRDQRPFATLVERHGPLIFGVCRRVLGPSPEAEDAFQATFLVLISKAESTAFRAALGPWLYGVAHRIARKAQFKRSRRFAVEKQVDPMPQPFIDAPDTTESDELQRAFDEELAELPEAMRQAVVLCELQGVGRAVAAKQLRIAEGTLSSRLGRARKLLKDRLSRRGFALIVPATAAVSGQLTGATVGLAHGAVGEVPMAVWSLAQEALKDMLISNLKLGAVFLAVAVGFTGFGFLAIGYGGDEPTPKLKVGASAKAAPPTEIKPVAANERVEAGKQPNAGPVANVNGRDVGREEFAEFLIRKYGSKEIDGFVMRKIVSAEAEKKGVVVQAEMEATHRETLKALGDTEESFRKRLLKEGHYTPESYREETLIPMVTMQKLVADSIRVTEADLRKLFEGLHGEKRATQLIVWEKDIDLKLIQKQTDEAKFSAAEFDRIASGQARKEFAAIKGHFPAIGRAEYMERAEAITEAAFVLKKAGDVSELIKLEGGFALVKLVSIVTPDVGKRFEVERPDLEVHARGIAMNKAVSNWFETAKEKAKPVYFIPPAKK